jgi:hypothetical protein
MNEKEYWTALEFRHCGEFGGMSDRRFAELWCDGVIPEIYQIHEEPPMILGRAWICRGPRQSEWKFQLFLPRQFRAIDEIDWNELLPSSDMTKWIAVNWDKRIIQIEPAAAVPDLD